MCPFCIGAATWAAAGVISAGGLGALAVAVTGQRRADSTPGATQGEDGATTRQAQRDRSSGQSS
jgi:hypothetical protein